MHTINVINTSTPQFLGSNLGRREKVIKELERKSAISKAMLSRDRRSRAEFLVERAKAGSV